MDIEVTDDTSTSDGSTLQTEVGPDSFVCMLHLLVLV